MTESKPTSEGLREGEITGAIDLLETRFEIGGIIISEVSFPDSDGKPVKIMRENNAGSEEKTDIELLLTSDVEVEDKDSI